MGLAAMHRLPSTLSIVCERWNRNSGGYERYLADLAAYLDGLGIPAHVCITETSRPAAGLAKPPFGPGKPVLAILPFLGASNCQLHSGLHASAYAAEKESFHTAARRLLHPLAQRLNRKRLRLLKLQDQWLGGTGRPRIMTLSRLTAHELAKRYAIAADAICLNPHGVDTSRFSPGAKGPSGILDADGPSLAKQPVRLLFVAHNSLLKGLHCLFQAMGRLSQTTRIFLQVVGNGPSGLFARLAKRLGISAEVGFLGNVDHNQPVRLYQTSCALIHPTYYDPCSLVVLEALACGCPVVTTRRNGAAKLFTHGPEGLVVDHPGNIPALTEALRVMQDRPSRLAMRQAARALSPMLDRSRHMRETLGWLGLEAP